MDRPWEGTQSPQQKPDILSLIIPNLSRRPTTTPPNETHPSPAVSGPRSEFTLFPALPAELRLKIWEFALPGPRVVEIKAPPPSFADRPPDSALDDFTSSCAIPTLLHVNSEARGIALKHYELSFATGTFPPRIYFSFERDTLYFPEYVFDDGGVADITPFIMAISSSERARVRRVAVDVDRWFASNDNSDYVDEESSMNGQVHVAALSGLQELCWVVLEPLPDGRCSSCEDKVQPKWLGEVGLEDRAKGYNKSIYRDTDVYLDKMAKNLGQGWRRPVVRVVALTRDGVRVPPATADIAEMDEVRDSKEEVESSA
ncbi:hypothetical protein MMC30_005990 [Trapelia coarctata]|nr:hypothetical protein [Trapelia coarctata]